MREQSLLTWYIMRGVGIFERSPMGAMIDMCELRSAVTRRCTYKPKGGQPCQDGIVIKPTEVTLADGHREVFPFGDWCPACNGTGFVKMRERGSGEPLTARPTQTPAPHARNEHNDEDLTRYAIVTRRLTGMGALAGVILDAYGPNGDASSETPQGRAWGVASHTESGRRLIVEYLESGNTVDNPYLVLERLRVKYQDEECETRTLLADAAFHARGLLAEAELKWESLIDG